MFLPWTAPIGSLLLIIVRIFDDCYRPLAKLGKAVKIADASSQRKAERETVSAVAIAFEVHNTAPGVHSGTLGIAAGMYSVR